VRVSVVSNPNTGSCTYRTTFESLSEKTAVEEEVVAVLLVAVR